MIPVFSLSSLLALILKNYSVLGRFSCLGWSWQLCSDRSPPTPLNYKKDRINKVKPSFFPQFCRKCNFITLFSCKIYTPRFTFSLNVSTFWVCPHFLFQLNETSRMGIIPILHGVSCFLSFCWWYPTGTLESSRRINEWDASHWQIPHNGTWSRAVIIIMHFPQ